MLQHEQGGRSVSKDHSGPILSERRPSPPGARRERGFVLAILAFLGVAGIVAAIVLKSRSSDFTLTGYRTALVERRDLGQSVQVTGSIEMGSKRFVLAPEAGSLVEALYEAGDWVPQGRTVARVSAPDLADDLVSARSSHEATLRSLERAAADRDFARKKEALDLAAKEGSLSDAQEALADARDLAALGSASAREVTTAEKAVEDARSALDLARMQYEFNEKSHGYDLEDLRAKRDELDKSIADLEARIASLAVKAPIGGRILEWKASPGDILSRYAQLASIADTSRPEAVFQVPETVAPSLSAGMTVAITVGTRSYPGKITGVGLAATASDTYGTTVEATASFDSPPADLSEGVTATGEISLGVKKDALVLPRGPWLSSGGNRWIFIVRDGRAMRSAAGFGASDASSIELLTGAEAGDAVIVSDYGSFIDFESIALGGAQ